MTYLGLAGLVVLPAAVVAIIAGLRAGARWWATTGLTLAVLLVLTIVFDNLMIYVDLFRYTDAHLTGIMVYLAPVEDLAWPLVAALVLPALWELFGRRRTRVAEEIVE